jgi:hypothetical protein
MEDFDYKFYLETEQLGVNIPRTGHTVIASGHLDGTVFHVRDNVFDACNDLRKISDELKSRITEDSINNRDIAIVFDPTW